MKCAISSLALGLLISGASAFTVLPSSYVSKVISTSSQQTEECYSPSRLSPLFMGRAAAVRAATKGKTDAKKAKVNAYYGKKIIMAVKQGGSADPIANRQLGELIKAAKQNSVPVDNINRAIKRATEKDAGDFSEATFEAYGFGGASLIINVLSDNSNRSTADVKTAVNKLKGKMAEQGSVLFMYDLKGKIEIPAVVDEEELLMAAIDAGVEDMELVEGDEEGTSIVYTDPKETSAMFDAVKSIGLEEGSKMGLAHISKAPVECTEEDFDKNMAIIEALEELDDVDSVEHNMSN
jgi:YebC/PmpR family DNA-binding regulatory protein